MNNSIEGYWYVVNLNKNENNILSSDAITQIFYKSETQQLKTNTFRIDKSGEEIYSYSLSVQFNESDGMYINKFSIGDKWRVSKMELHMESSLKNQEVKLLILGIGINLDDNIIYRQHAYKIIELEIKSCKKKYKEEWRKNFLLEHSKIISS